ncbi:Transcription factor GRAS [Arabidopsis thaliana x Arabidopsis arenosa]|uniref:Transcription factor GRAS n=1 Tax=Arabidopsis thaliana x Arabidopsis arenosa TaxID=1240361 RepID=A0A8T2AYX4_9BRAS|nr:Transcription factor GRAS [Arabidopsis thaliana x Arabidopsis arenosa]
MDNVRGSRHNLKKVETMMLKPLPEIAESIDDAICHKLSMWPEEANDLLLIVEAISRGDLKLVLVACAKAVSENNLLMARWCMGELRGMVSISGEPIQRLGAYMLEGLVARLAASGSSIYKSLQSREPESYKFLSYVYVLHEVCPYFKFGYISANGAIAEAMKDEERIHIIDFQIGQGSQWISLIQAFAARPGGAPNIRITGVGDVSVLVTVKKRLEKLAKKFDVPFRFNAVSRPSCEVEVENLDVREGEALGVNFAYMLHHLPDESVSMENHRDRLLRMVKSLSPKVVTLVEQECNTNTSPFLPRFLETLSYYTAMFESIDVMLPRNHKERINIEQHCLARDVVNIIACEGAERIERHELLGKWKSRFSMAGFEPYPLSSIISATITALLRDYSYGYAIEERDGALYLGWMGRILVSSCAWK